MIYFIYGDIMKISINNNKTSNINIYKANTFIKRFFGLMGKKNINYGLLFNNCSSIHTFFMKEDILLIELHNNIIYNIKIIKPWRIYISKYKKNTSILELPINTSNYFNKNDQLIIK